MAIRTGMRARDLQQFLIVAREYGVIILVRHTNEDSLRYVQVAGYYPKPAAVKAKTADMNPGAVTRTVKGRDASWSYRVAGLVVHPGFHGGCFAGAKGAKAQDCWNRTMEILSPSLSHERVDSNRPGTWRIWGVERVGVHAPRWRWRVDIDAASPHFGCLQLKTAGIGWCYIHGDYDLKDVIVAGKETENRRVEGKLDGVKNFTPELYRREFESIRRALNARIGVDMVQHGADAQFAWHGDEPITVVFPDGRHLLLYDAVTVQRWYQGLNREVLATKGTDYLNERSRVFHFVSHGIPAPRKLSHDSWGK